MLYTINKIIEFDPDEGTLVHVVTNDIVTLTLPARRLLVAILESNGEILSRDALFSEVWDKYGLRSSNSNLNQYLSLLRRSIAVLGCGDFITTLPKVGIKLNEDVTIIKTEHQATSSVPDNPKQHIPLPSEKRLRLQPGIRWTGLFIIAMGILAAGAGYMWKSNDILDPVANSYVMTGGCELVLLKTVNSSVVTDIQKQVKNILNNNKLICNANIRLYFDSYVSSSVHKYGRTMLSYCGISSKGYNISCDNIYYSDWGVNEN